MTTPDELSALTLEPKFYAQKVAGALLKGIPFFGPSLEHYIFGSLAEVRFRRVEATLREVAEGVHAIRTESESLSNEDFVQLLESVLPSVAKATRESRRARFRDLLIQAGTLCPGAAEWASANFAARLLEELPDSALEIIAIIARATRMAEQRDWMLVRSPSTQFVPANTFSWDSPVLGDFPLGFDWIVVEEAARLLRERRIIRYASHDARGGFGSVSIAELGKFLVYWTVRQADGTNAFADGSSFAPP